MGFPSDRDELITGQRLVSPDGLAAVWSVKIWKPELALASSRLVIKDERQSRDRVVVETRVEASGDVIGVAGRKSVKGDRVHSVCPIDWSSDGSRLLFEESFGPLDSDNFSTGYWILDRHTAALRSIDFGIVSKTLEDYWRRKGNPATNRYGLIAIGWIGDSKSRRIVLAAEPLQGEDWFFGYWSIDEDGRDPRLITEKGNGFSVPRFGK